MQFAERMLKPLHWLLNQRDLMTQIVEVHPRPLRR
jgi:hypothetical protein